jgi:uncharacterized protein YbjT (DUF2867 family)
MVGVSTVVSAIQGFAGPGDVSPQKVDRDGNANLVEAAQTAGVGHFVLVSGVGAAADSPLELFRAKHDAEQLVQASDVAWTIVRATAFMETWATIIGEPLRTKGTTMVFGKGDNPINFVSVTDVASLIEQAVTDPSMKGRVIELGGPEDLTFNEVTATLREVTGAPLKPDLARQMRAAVVMDTAAFTFDATETRRSLPGLPCTDLTVAVKRHLGAGA